MDGGTIFWGGVAIAILWWLFSRLYSGKSDEQTITYTDTKTGEVKKEVRKTRQAQNKLVIDKPVDFEINPEIKEVLDTLENTTSNIFLTGKAGTGKSTLLRYFRATTQKFPVVVAPTGIAAVNVQGQTIHSFFGWGIDVTPERVRKVSYERSQVYRRMKMLIIDEISMVRADLFECIDTFLRLNTGKPDQPFGGVQIVAIGDLYQLPPIVKGAEKKFFETKYSSPFFFSTDAFVKGAFKKFELNKVYRQKDQVFVSALNAIREGIPNDEHINLLNQAVIESEPEDFEDYVNLVTTNKMAKEINDARMSKLPAEPVTYKGTMFGTFKEKNAPTDLELSLKSGAQVLLLNNDKDRKWVNGDVVKVLETNPHSILVEFEDDTVQEVGTHTWETIRFVYDEEEEKIIPKKIGGFTQLPVKPAWAMTIHKAQGKTFDKVFTDLGAGAFAEGQTYVALSRCKSLEGLKLASPLMLHDVFVNEKVSDFMSFAHSGNQKPRTKNTSETEAAAPGVKQELKAKSVKTKSGKTLSKEEFVLQAISKLRTKKYKGIHAVYSGFNKAFREYFDEDPVECVSELEKQGLVVTHPVRGGVMIYNSKDVGARSDQVKRSEALTKILDN